MGSKVKNNHNCLDLKHYLLIIFFFLESYFYIKYK